MTNTDSATTAAGRVWSVTEQSSPSRLPRIDAVESMGRYFRFVHRALELNQHLAMSWTGPVGVPSGVIPERAESGGQVTPKRRPKVAECTTTRADPVPEVACERVAAAEAIASRHAGTAGGGRPAPPVRPRRIHQSDPRWPASRGGVPTPGAPPHHPAPRTHRRRPAEDRRVAKARRGSTTPP